MIRAVAALGALACFAATAAAAESTPAPLEGAALFDAPRIGPELWIGGGPFAFPRYPGATRDRVRLIPEVTGGWGERFEFDVLDGARYALVQGGGLSAGPAARVRFGRRPHDDRRNLVGLRGFSDTVEIGGYVAYDTDWIALDSTLTQDPFRAHRGAVWETRALFQGAVGRVGASMGPFARAMSRPFAESYYGVPPGTTGRAAYDARAGFERVGLMAAAEWRITDAVGLRGYAEVGRLVGSAARSSLVRGEGGSRDQFAGGAFLVWRVF